MSSSNRPRRASFWNGNWANLRDIEIVCAVILERKTTGAADRLGISQSAVSRAIAKIEARMKTQLFHRDGGRLSPTAEALRLFERGMAVFGILAELDEPVPDGTAREITILAPPTISHLFLIREIAAFAKAHPDIKVSFDVATIADLASWIAEGRGDVGISDARIAHSGVAIEPFIETPAICLMRRDHPLARRRRIVPTDLDGVDYVAIHRRHSLRGALDHIFNKHNVHPHVTIETGSAQFAAELIQRGLGVSVLNPFPLILQRIPNTVHRPFDADLSFQTNFIVPANIPSPVATRMFIDFIKTRRNDVLDTVRMAAA
ncbi:MAG TPA: LysR family transcriptional regulator [Hyphomicrobiaceae bacterium]